MIPRTNSANITALLVNINTETGDFHRDARSLPALRCLSWLAIQHQSTGNEAMSIPFSNIKGLLFDKDGTLFDFQKSWSDWCFRFIHKISPDPQTVTALSSALGFDLETRAFHPESAVIAGTPQDTVDAVASVMPKLDSDQAKDLIIASSAEDFQVPVTPLRPLLVGLIEQGLTLGIATNDAESVARVHMEQFELIDLFRFISGYDSGFGAKPAPGQMQEFMRATKLAPEQTIMIGDSTHDLEAGRAAGMFTLGVLTGVAREPALAPYADMVVQDISVLPDLFS